MASTTRRVSTGLTAAATSAISAISASSTLSRPAVSTMTTSRTSRRAASTPPRAISTTEVPSGARKTGMSRLLPRVSSWSAAAGRYGSAATSSGRRPSLTTCRASLAAVVVLPEPWRPATRMTAGLPCRWNVRSPADRSAISSSLTIADDLLAGGQAAQDVGPDRPLADPRHEVLDDLEVDVRLEQAEPDLAHRGIDVGLADPAAAGQVAERLAQALAERVEHPVGLTPFGSGGGAGGRPGGARVLTRRGGRSVAHRPRRPQRTPGESGAVEHPDVRPGPLTE